MARSVTARQAINSNIARYRYVDIDSAASVKSISDLLSLQPEYHGQRVLVASFYAYSIVYTKLVGGGLFFYDSTRAKSNHNGIAVISPSAVWNGNHDTLSDFLTGANETDPNGYGCWLRIYDFLTPFHSGALADIKYDDYVALQAVIDVVGNDGVSNGGLLRIPKGDFYTSGELVINRPFVKAIGFGWRLSRIISTSTTENLIRVTSSRQSVELSGLSLSRSVTPISGAGLKFEANVNQCNVSDIIIEGHYIGFSGTATAYSSARNLIVQKNISHGVDITGDGATNAAQWNMSEVLSQQNGGNGYNFVSTVGASQMIVGEMVNCKSALNSGNGASFIGLPTVPIQDIRIVGGFYGSDGDDEIYLDTYGMQHVLSDVFVEQPGRTATGPSLSTPASGVGSGINVTSNNDDVTIDNPTSTSVSDYCIKVGAVKTIITGGKSMFGNLSGTGKDAIHHTAGSLTMTGHNTIGSNHIYGMRTHDGSKVILVGCDLSAATGPFIAESNAQYAQIIGCRPISLIATQITNGVVIGSAVGGNKGPGTINSAGDIYKNNAAYTNP